VITWAGHHPPLFYALAVVLEKLGLGRDGGMIISLAAGAVRLVLADRVFRAIAADAPPKSRLFANAIHAFVPVGIRMDVFYSPESLAATLCVAAVSIALVGRWVWAGIFLGLALLTKSTSVAAVPAVLVALAWRWPIAPKKIAHAAAAVAIAVAILLPWAKGNIERFGTPYANTYLANNDPVWKKPMLERHATSYYVPKLRLSELAYPFYRGPPLSMPNVAVFDAWGDYYNFLSVGHVYNAPPELAANAFALGRKKLVLHVALAVLGVIMTIVLSTGMGGALRRFLARTMTTAEFAHGGLALGYVFIMFWYAIWVAYEHDGPIKAAYALGASTMLSWWTARPLARLTELRASRIPAMLLIATTVVIALLLRLYW
jgi:4-amino-4-deoxy-L-arabinose transferase-like glycosyltransferase